MDTQSVREGISYSNKISIPPITAGLESVDEYKPTINPKVVITPEVRPN